MSNINQKATTTVEINGQQARNELDLLKREAEAWRKKMIEASEIGDIKGFKKAEQELRKVNSQMRTMQKSAIDIDKVLSNLSTAGPKELQRTLRALISDLNSGKIKRGSQEWDVLQEKIRKVRNEITKVNSEAKVSQGVFSRLSDGFNKYFGMITSLIAGITGLTLTARKCVNEFAVMEEAEAGVLKYTGMTKDEVKELNEEFRKIDTRTARTRLNDLAADAGRLGIKSKEDILEFVDAADKINGALGKDLGEDAVKNIGKLAMMFGEDKTIGLRGAMLATGSAINEVAMKSSAAEPYLVSFLGRVAGAANQAKLGQADIIGFASVLDQNMQKQEMAATAFQTLLMKMYQEPAKFAKLAGKDAKEFADLMKTDINKALLDFIETLSKKGGLDNLAPMFQEMGLNGVRASGVISTLAGKINDVRVAQEIANKAYQEGTSVIDEFNIRNNTVQGDLEKRRKIFNDLTIELGEKLLPVMKYTITSGSAMVKILSSVTSFLIKHGATLLHVATAIGIYTIAMNASIVVDKLKVIWTNHIIFSIKRMYSVMKAHPYALLVAIVTALISKLVILKRSQDMVTQSEKSHSTIRKKTEEDYANQAAKIDSLISVINKENIANNIRIDALKKLKEIIPDYNGMLTDEGRLINNNKDAIEKYLIQLEKQIRLKAAQEELEELFRKKRLAQKNLTLQEKEESEAKANLTAAKFVASRRGEQASTQGTRNLTTGLDHGVKTWESEYNIRSKAVKETKEELSEIETAIKEINSEISKTSLGIITGSSDDETEEEDIYSKLKDKIKKLENAASIYKAHITSLYATGQINKQEYDAFIEEGDRKLLRNKMALYDKNTSEYNALLTQLYEMDIKHQQGCTKETLQEIDNRLKEEKKKLTESYADNLISKTAYEDGIFQLEHEALKRKRDNYVEGSSEYQEYQLQMEELAAKQQIKLREEYEKKLDSFRKSYRKESLKELNDQELTALNYLLDNKLISQEEFEKYKLAISKKYRSLALKANKEITGDESETDPENNNSGFLSNLFKQESDRRKLQLDQLKMSHEQGLIAEQDYYQRRSEINAEFYDGILSKAEAIYSQISAITQAYSEFNQASQELEIAKINKKYDSEIKAAGNNSKKVAVLEERKEQELAKVKSKYADKAFKMQIAQGLAQTAMSAINAYSSAAAVPYVGYILAPIAAASAVAAGMIQMATIQKQHQAAKQGYYAGGFTPSGRWDEEQGVVHSDEFIANRYAVRNKQIRPVLDLLDRAQKNNTVGSLKAADVSRVLGNDNDTGSSQGVSSSSQMPGNLSNELMLGLMGKMTDSITRLNDQLEKGIESIVAIDGVKGFENQYKHYKKLNSNKSR